MSRPPARKHRYLAAFVALVAVSVAAVVLTVGRDRGPGRSSEAFCAQITSAADLDESLASLDAGGVQRQVDALRQAQRVAPTEIAGQVATLVDVTDGLATTLEGAGSDRATALDDALRARQDQLADADAAGKAVEDYARATCGLELNKTAVPAA